jgi:hypothetical protein
MFIPDPGSNSNRKVEGEENKFLAKNFTKYKKYF